MIVVIVIYQQGFLTRRVNTLIRNDGVEWLSFKRVGLQLDAVEYLVRLPLHLSSGNKESLL